MKKNLLLLSLILSISSLMVSAKAFSVTESGGWLESAFVKWTPKSDAESYNVYYSGEGVSNVKIDNFLIREYPEYFRADIVGLKAGNYTIVVKPVVSGVEGSGITTSTIEVKPYDRSGFAFSNGRIPGAYKADGTLKDNAVVIYITENTKDNVELTVANANSNPCVGLQEIFDGFKKGSDLRPLVVRIVGNVSHLANMQNGDVVVENKNNAQSYITIEGIGDDAVANGWGIRLKSASNVEIRNLGFMNCNSSEGDNIGLQQKNDHIWVHHCDMFYGHAGGDSDQQKGDGALDVKKSTYVTISYNHYWDTGKTNLLGLGEKTTEGLYITYHHNWFDHSDSRHPRVRYYSAHVYNNFYDGISKYGAGATLGASVFMEKNYFRNCKYPMMISMQGTDVYNSSTDQNDYKNSPTFSKEDGGIIKAFDNYIVGAQRFVAYGDTDFPNPTVDFDAYVVSTANETVPSSVVSAYGSNQYNNFDTNSSIMYQYSADSPEDAMNKVIQYSGRMFGGDFNWTFNNSVDDNSYAVNSALKSALTNYTSQLVAIQGDGQSSGSTDPSEPQVPIDGDETHNFTLSGKESTFYAINGNLSTSKGSVDYAGMTLTQCLKIESSTSVTFDMDNQGELLLIFNDNFNGRVKINGVDYTVDNGILEVDLPAGTYDITKNDTANLFYMSIKWQTSTGVGNFVTKPEISVYPNPLIDKLYISSMENISKVDIYNLSGVNVKSVIGSQLESIDVGNLPQGSYVIIVTLEDGNLFKQIILKK